MTSDTRLRAGVAPPWARKSRAGRRRARLRPGSDAGFTLVEVLLVAAMLPIVLIAVLNPFEFAQSQTPKNVEYAHAITEASAGFQRMMRDIRQAYRINSADPNAIDFNAVIDSSDLEIVYECDLSYPSNTGNTHHSEYHRCRRVSATTGSSLPAVTSGTVAIDRLLDGTAANPVFTYRDASGAVNATNPTYVEAKVQVPARGELNNGLKHEITFNNGTTLPNLAIR